MLEKKRKGGCWKTGLAVVAVLGVVMLFFWFQDKKLRDYGVDQIEAMGLSDDEELVYLAIANHYHNRAANSGTRATKKSTGTASKSEYWSALEELIEGELGRIPETPDFEAIEGNSYLWREGMEHYIVTLKPGGEYEKAHHWDSDSDYSDAHETATGKWSANEKGFHWKPDDGSEEAQEILRMGRDGFALKISEVEASFWQRRR